MTNYTLTVKEPFKVVHYRVRTAVYESQEGIFKKAKKMHPDAVAMELFTESLPVPVNTIRFHGEGYQAVVGGAR